MVDWKKIRRDFPITKRFTYLDHASASPMPRPVYEATLRYYKELSGFADFSWNRWIARREEVRQKIAQFIGARPEEITFTSSTSHGMNLTAELIANQGGVLTNLLEFPATTVPWIHRGAKLKFIEPEDGVISIDRLKQSLTAKIKTILTSFVQFQNGFRQDLEAVGKIKGNRFFVVNATQGFGYLPIDVERAKVDFLATNSYKWLMAGYGGGILYMNRKWICKFKPQSAGWRSVPHPEGFDNRHAPLKQEASRYEYGCPPFPHIFAIGASLDYLSGIGFPQVWSRIESLTEFLIDQLRKYDFEILSPLNPSFRSGIVVFRVKNALKLTNQLLARRIYVSARGGGIRVAPHVYNTEADIENLMNVLKEELRRL
ncbi:MAG: aminotransferase class V-fold PLP-dependent enzyme [Candidatus Omnitrophica bacterium]|nr:aminotransferase class V-fold PLP-dependent enzyme [Candidatus Omnitrophota bacterium]